MNVLRRYAGVLICFFGLALFVQVALLRVLGNHYTPGEVLPAARLALSAQRAIVDGQILLQFANDYAFALQPVFLYYTPVFYGLAAIIQLASGSDPTDSLVMTVALLAAITVSGVYQTIIALGGQKGASAITAVSLPFSPYYLTDVFSRASFAELSAWAIYPWVIFFFVRFCQNPRWQQALGLILATALFIVCHKIFLGWGLIFIALFGFSWIGWRRLFKLAPTLLLALAAALSLSGPYWLNALLIAKALNIGGTISSAAFGSLTSNLWVLWPFPYTQPELKAQFRHFSLQLGPLALFAMIFGWSYIPANRAILATLITTLCALAFTCSFFVIPSIWLYVPTPLTVIQFPYRLLLFATTFGAIAFGLLLSAMLRTTPPLAYASCALVMAMLLGFWWQIPLSPNIPGELESIAITGSETYFETSNKTLQQPVAMLPRSVVEARGNTAVAKLDVTIPGLTVLPVQFSRLLVTTLNDKPVEIFNYKGAVAIQLLPGIANIQFKRIEVVGFACSLLASIAFAGGLIMLLHHDRRRAAPVPLSG